ncbi:hypothetical protein GPALN_002062 [Globodera pallida]|nr:hypothetical protein GPALN_002062 [Globodera pallida]
MSEVAESPSSISDLTDAELRTQLTSHGITAGPIVVSTRKVYEKKLQSVLSGDGTSSENLENGTMNGGGSGTMNGGGSGTMNGGGTPLRETTPLMNFEANSSPRPTPVPEEQGSDDDDEPSESARLLTPGEVRKFRLSFKGMDSPNSNAIRQRREYSPLLGGATNSLLLGNGTHRQAVEKKKPYYLRVQRVGVSLFVLGVTGAFLMALVWLREHFMPIFEYGKGQ